ncbi:MAG TPA: response regulator transcription factor [Phnomibacter sp.]|nr:response regulator transcription factor [Phnomibacter sp.]
MKKSTAHIGSILLVEDEESMHETLKMNLSLEGYEVASAFDGQQALEKLEGEYFDLVVLDIMIPEIDGISVLETMRLKKITSPVLILSARNSSTDRILGLKKGADDYLTKPFALEELLLRIEKLLQKSKLVHADSSPINSFSFGGHTINFNAQEATLSNGEKIALSKKESMLIQLLIEHSNEVVTRETILRTVWGYNVFPTTRTIDNFLLNIRKYFEEDSRNPRYFHSVRGVGYKFTP